MVISVLSVPGSPAAAQLSTTCGMESGLGTARIDLDQPAAGAVVSGRDVKVRGAARASIGQLSRVEITLGGVTQASNFPPGFALNFEQSFDVTNVAPGNVTLRVVACGTGNLTGVLARGEREIDLTVDASPSSSTPPSTGSPTTLITLPTGGIVGGTPTSTAAVPTTRAGQTGTSTSTPSSTAAPPTTEAPVVVEARPEPVRPPPRSDAPLVLTEADDEGSSGPPLWVGAVVGISGGLGLLFSATSSRRRGGRVPPAVEPVDPDLVDAR